MRKSENLSSTVAITTLWGIFLTTSVASIGYFVNAKPHVGISLLILAVTALAFAAAGVYFKNRGIFRELSTKIDKINDSLEFVSGLKHCGKFCGIRSEGWRFGDEYTLIKGRDSILNTLVDIIARAENDSDVMLISSGFDLGDSAWNQVLKKAQKIKLRVIVNEDRVSPNAESFVQLLSGVSELRTNENTNGIRVLVVKDKEGYICNSKSKSQAGIEEDYWAIYSCDNPTIKMMAGIFEGMWEAPGNKPLIYKLNTLSN